MATTVFNQSEGCCPVRDHNGPITRLSSSVHSAHITSSTDCAAGPLKIPFLQMRNQGSGRSQSPPTGSEGLAEEPGSSNFPRGKPSFLPGVATRIPRLPWEVLHAYRKRREDTKATNVHGYQRVGWRGGLRARGGPAVLLPLFHFLNHVKLLPLFRFSSFNRQTL